VRSEFDLTLLGRVLFVWLEAYGRRPRTPRSLRPLFNLTPSRRSESRVDR